MSRRRRVLIALLVGFVGVNAGLWLYVLADHRLRMQAWLLAGDAFCIGWAAMGISGRLPYSMGRWGRRSLLPPPEAEQLEKWTE